MDLVRELKDVRFELSLRGYDCEAVDAFLAKLRGDITSVQEENESAVARIRELEQAVSEGGGASSETEGTLRRTLVLAQRLADETEAEAKKDAAEMLEKASTEAEQLRATAELESQSMKEEGKRELDNARDEAATIRETVAEEAARTRSEARVESEAMLAEAEQRGMERVAVLEQAAQVEVATMREPIRAEVVELEGARARVMADIAALENHLEQQRVRVRTAVEALRVGMSGSIEDLERVADDDELLATQPAPEISHARASDVEVAPDIEIVESVSVNAPRAPGIDDIEHAARAAAAAGAVDQADAQSDVSEAAEVVEDAEAALEAEMSDPAEAVEGEVVEAALTDVDDAVDEAAEMGEVETDADVDVNVETDLGPNTEPIPVVESVDDDEELIVQLEDEPTALFGTDLAGDAEIDVAVEEPEFVEAVVEPISDPVVEKMTPEGASDDEASDEEAASEAADQPQPVVAGDDADGGQVSFVQRFAELLDAQPIGRDR